MWLLVWWLEYRMWWQGGHMWHEIIWMASEWNSCTSLFTGWPPSETHALTYQAWPLFSPFIGRAYYIIAFLDQIGASCVWWKEPLWGPGSRSGEWAADGTTGRLLAACLVLLSPRGQLITELYLGMPFAQIIARQWHCCDRTPLTQGGLIQVLSSFQGNRADPWADHWDDMIWK
jgi:hypothetical protein